MNTLALHHILVKSQTLAEELVQELQLGADFSYLAQEYSTCPSANNQGFAGHHRSDSLPLNLLQALFETNENTGPFVGPVKTELGFHIIKAVETPQRPLLIDD